MRCVLDNSPIAVFDDSGLERVIQNRLGRDLRFGELKKPLIVTAYDIWNQAAVVQVNTGRDVQKVSAAQSRQ